MTTPRKLDMESTTVRIDQQTIPVRRLDAPPLFAGLRQSWLEGRDGDYEFALACGAGLGTPYILITVTLPDGTKVYECADIQDLMTARLAAIQEEHA